MTPDLSPQDAFRAYACFGGVPYYLEQLDQEMGLRDNLLDLFFDPSGLLYDEPQMLLRQELSEPALYNSILRAIANGCTRQKEIADHVGMEVTSAPRYLSTLVALGIIERACPYGENPETSRKGIYRILEASFAFWFRFVMPRTSAIEDGMGALVLNAVGEDALATYMGPRFERVCREWLRDRAVARELPLDVTEIGSWWGTDPSRRETTDIDVLASDDRKRLLIGECKYRNSFDETETIEALIKRRSLVRGYEASWFYLFSRWPVHESTQLKYANNNVGFVTLDDMYACS